MKLTQKSSSEIGLAWSNPYHELDIYRFCVYIKEGTKPTKLSQMTYVKGYTCPDQTIGKNWTGNINTGIEPGKTYWVVMTCVCVVDDERLENSSIKNVVSLKITVGGKTMFGLLPLKFVSGEIYPAQTITALLRPTENGLVAATFTTIPFNNRGYQYGRQASINFDCVYPMVEGDIKGFVVPVGLYNAGFMTSDGGYDNLGYAILNEDGSKSEFHIPSNEYGKQDPAFATGGDFIQNHVSTKEINKTPVFDVDDNLIFLDYYNDRRYIIPKKFDEVGTKTIVQDSVAGLKPSNNSSAKISIECGTDVLRSTVNKDIVYMLPVYFEHTSYRAHYMVCKYNIRTNIAKTSGTVLNPIVGTNSYFGPQTIYFFGEVNGRILISVLVTNGTSASADHYQRLVEIIEDSSSTEPLTLVNLMFKDTYMYNSDGTYYCKYSDIGGFSYIVYRDGKYYGFGQKFGSRYGDYGSHVFESADLITWKKYTVMPSSSSEILDSSKTYTSEYDQGDGVLIPVYSGSAWYMYKTTKDFKDRINLGTYSLRYYERLATIPN